jgi:hypothetical protein
LETDHSSSFHITPPGALTTIVTGPGADLNTPGAQSSRRRRHECDLMREAKAFSGLAVRPTIGAYDPAMRRLRRR